MKNRLWLIVPWALFAAAALGWVGYWHYVANTVEQRLAAWAQAETARGAQVSYARIIRHGFPALMRLEVREAAYAPARGGWSARTGRVDLNINLLKPEHVVFESKAAIIVTRADGAATHIEADALIASWRTQGGALAQAGVEADNLRLDDPAKDGVLSARRLVFNIRPDARVAGDYQLSLEADALTLPRAVRSFESFGLDVEALRAAVVVEHGAALLEGADNDPLEPWRAAGGRLRFEALALKWGPLDAGGHGQGGLDAQRRLEGALELPIERPGPIFSALAQDPHADENARRALGLLAAGYAFSGDDIKLDVEAHDGVLRLEGLSVRTLAPVY